MVGVRLGPHSQELTLDVCCHLLSFTTRAQREANSHQWFLCPPARRYYSATILQMSGVEDDRLAIWLAALTAFINFIFTLVGVWLVERMGRRKLTLGSLAGECLGSEMHLPCGNMNETKMFQALTLSK